MVTVAVMTMILKMRRRRDGVDEEDGDDDGRALFPTRCQQPPSVLGVQREAGSLPPFSQHSRK